MAKQSVNITTYLPRVLILGIHAPDNRTKDIGSYYDEFLSLVATNKVTFHETLFWKIRTIDPVYFLTKGKREELRQFCEENKIEEMIISESFTPQQERNLSEMLNVVVFDRTKLILEIFEKSAHSAEGKTQVAVAMLHYKKSRLAGKGVHMGQQQGGIGVRGGFGETAKERATRDIETQLLKHKKKLERLQRVRASQRKTRMSVNLPLVCLVGYTNAGKSTILNVLTKSCVLAEDKLFATLDTTTRELYIAGTKKGLISDSVGFIQNLPHRLIEAFKSTLDELQYADLLLQVIDISNPNWESHIKVVLAILQELKIEKDMLYVFNKIDKVQTSETLEEKVANYQPHVLICANNNDGLQPLKTYLHGWQPKSQ